MESAFFETMFREATITVTDYFLFATTAFVVFYFLLKNVLARRKIQKRFPKWSDYGRDIFFSLVTVAIFGVVSGLTFHTFWDYTTIYKESYDQYGLAYYLFTFVWMLFLHDTYFYWAHRLMHTKWLYRHVHKVHHLSTNPSPWTAYAFHPLEALIEAMILPLIAFTLPVHGSAIATFFFFQIAYNVYGHLGYELYPKGFHKTAIGKYINTSVAHNQHHARFVGNYGLYFLIWDRLMGTIRADYDEVYEATTGTAPRPVPGAGSTPGT